METIKDKQNSDVFPWIEVDTHPFAGTHSGIGGGFDVPRLRFHKMPESKTGHSGYFILIDHKVLDNLLVIKEKSLHKEDILAIERKISESNFFDMERVYEEAIFDGGQQTITIRDKSGIYKTVSLLRFTGRRSEKEVPVEFTNLYKWLMEYAESKCPPRTFGSREYKLQPLKE